MSATIPSQTSSQPLPMVAVSGLTVGIRTIVQFGSTNVNSARSLAYPGQAPFVELYNASAGTFQIRFPQSGITRTLPPNGWIQSPVSPNETSYEILPLSIINVTGTNSIVGVYYPSGVPIGHSMNLGGIAGVGNAIPSSATILSLPSGTANASATLGASASATSFAIASVTVSFTRASTGAFPNIKMGHDGIGQQMFLTINNTGVPIWEATFEASSIPHFFPVALVIPNTNPGITTFSVQLGTQSLNPLTGWSGAASIIGSVT